MTDTQLTNTNSPLKQFFAYGSTASINKVASNNSGFNYQLGIPSMYMGYHGKKVNRADVNGIGRMASQSAVFNGLGGYYTFNQEVCDAIGGYPLGAILRYKDPDAGYVRIVRSQIEDNTYDFVTNPEYIDDEHWRYVDQVMPTSCRPRIFPVTGSSAKKSGTLKLGDTFEAERAGVFTIQTGPSQTVDKVEGETAAYVWANVKKHDATEYHAAGMLAYLPPLSAAYSMMSRSVHSLYNKLEAKMGYTAFYASSPIQIYLCPGDTVKTTANLEIEYDADYQFIPLEA